MVGWLVGCASLSHRRCLSAPLITATHQSNNGDEALERRIAVVELLIEAGADINAGTCAVAAPIDVAISRGACCCRSFVLAHHFLGVWFLPTELIDVYLKRPELDLSRSQLLCRLAGGVFVGCRKVTGKSKHRNQNYNDKIKINPSKSKCQSIEIKTIIKNRNFKNNCSNLKFQSIGSRVQMDGAIELARILVARPDAAAQKAVRNL